jgi:hypothetical protein
MPSRHWSAVNVSLNMFINVTNKELAVRALLLGELLCLRIP